MKLLVTGGMGFIGSNFIRLLLRNGRNGELQNDRRLVRRGRGERRLK